ncbi:tetratricopeptide repeat protein 1 [Pelodytes ibericus]
MEAPEIERCESEGEEEEEEEERFHECVETEENGNLGGQDGAECEELNSPEGDSIGQSGAEISENEEEPDEEALTEQEKGLSEEEKEGRRKKSTDLKEEGNQLFKKGDYVDAEALYTQALQTCPAFYQSDRSILFSNRAAARMKQEKNEDAIKDCTKAIELNPDYIRALLRRAELYEKTDKLDEALADYKSVMERDTSCTQAREACMRLPKQIEERNEKLKDEMISKLKDLGNLVLRPFGLSTQNFQVNQDSSSGSYSINFVQSPNNNR